MIIEIFFLLIGLAVITTLGLFVSEFNQNISSSIDQATGNKYSTRKTTRVFSFIFVLTAMILWISVGTLFPTLTVFDSSPLLSNTTFTGGAGLTNFTSYSYMWSSNEVAVYDSSYLGFMYLFYALGMLHLLYFIYMSLDTMRG